MPKHPRLAACMALIFGLGATAFYARIVEPVYPLKDWLFLTLLAIFGWAIVFNVACFCFGQLLLRRLLGLRTLPPLEGAVQGMALGVVAFTMFMYIGGALALYGLVFALLLPAGMITAGACDGRLAAALVLAELKKARSDSLLLRFITAFGVVCTGLIYLGSMTPDALNYDALWYHAVIPQEYARQGRLVAFLGNYNMGIPHLHGMIHTWGFCVPGLDMPQRWMLLLHNEFGLFVWTLAGIAAGVSRLMGDWDLRATWTVMFLFPIIAVYDSNMGGAADHVAAFFTMPMLLALFELCRTFSAGNAALFAITSAGCFLTKYQALYLLVPMSVVFLTIFAARLITAWRRQPTVLTEEYRSTLARLWRVPLIVLSVGIAVTSPHFIKNIVFYGNPIYPFAQDMFPASWPIVPHKEHLVRYIFTDDNWIPHGTAFEKIRHALDLVLTFSWKPHYSFSKNWPAFGSLFTLMLPFLILMKRPKLTALSTFIGLGALFMWGISYNVDRNLQLILPLLATVTGALIVSSFRLGLVARFGVVPLIAFQVVWGMDAYFYSAHDRIVSAISLIKSGFDDNTDRRFAGYRGTFRALGQTLPENARVLLHASHLSLGLNREVIQDWDGFQGFISYDSLRTARDVYGLYKSRGITHILYQPGERAAPTKQAEILFHAFVSRYAVPLHDLDGYRLMGMADTPPPPEAPYRVGVLGLGGYADGIYPIERLNTNEHLPAHVREYLSPEDRITDIAAALTTLDALVIGNNAQVSPDLLSDFQFLVTYPQDFTVYLRRR